MSFRCFYCRIDHDESERSDEHIIPQSIGNKNYTLKNCCRTINHALAYGVENQFHELATIREILLLLNPSRPREVYLGPLKTRRGTTEHRYLIDGKDVLCDRMELATRNNITISVKAKDGTIHPFNLQLPFEVPARLTGSEKLTKTDRVNKKFAAARQKL